MSSSVSRFFRPRWQPAAQMENTQSKAMILGIVERICKLRLAKELGNTEN
jgi:hypothetical protein